MWSGFTVNCKIFDKMKTLSRMKISHPIKRNNFSHSTFSASEIKRNEVEVSTDFVPFLDVVKLRRSEAKRSILVQVHSSQSFKDLHNYCSLVGSIKNMFHYTTGVEPMHFIVVEFETEEDVSNIMRESAFLDDHQIVPVHSSFLWFRASHKRLPKLKQIDNAAIAIENGTYILKDSEINEALKKAKDISDQMVTLHNLTKLNEVGTRLRFLTAKQVEEALTGMFPEANAMPFGSSVNGCGKMGCDLDLVLRFTKEKQESERRRLVFHCKASSGSERSTSQRHMEAIGDLLQLFLPGCAQVRRILQARVPIIKYHQQFTDVECDLSMSNMTGVYMSDFLYLMGSLDERVRPLIFTIRKWAFAVGLTNSSPGRWITNFSLTLLVLAFLQKPLHSAPILPSLNRLVKLARSEDRYITEDGINCTFLRDLRLLNHKTENTDSLASLLKQFFEFYSQFDFSKKAVCLNEAVAITKPEHSPMYIVNPLERGLNVSKNVSLEEVERFKGELRNAAWLLESQENSVSNWGILGLFQNSRKTAALGMFQYNSRQGTRLVDLNTLFEDEEEVQKVEFKNEDLKQQVQEIKKKTGETLRSIEKQESKVQRKLEKRRR